MEDEGDKLKGRGHGGGGGEGEEKVDDWIGERREEGDHWVTHKWYCTPPIPPTHPPRGLGQGEFLLGARLGACLSPPCVCVSVCVCTKDTPQVAKNKMKFTR